MFNSDDEYPIVKACGTTPPNLIVSSSNRLRLNFKTDGSRNATGFKASWTIETVYSITSPDYPLPYLGVANIEVKLFHLVESNTEKTLKISVFGGSKVDLVLFGFVVKALQ